MLDIFNPKKYTELDIKCDQYYINSRKDEINYKKLPRFISNGSYFRLEKPKIIF